MSTHEEILEIWNKVNKELQEDEILTIQKFESMRLEFDKMMMNCIINDILPIELSNDIVNCVLDTYDYPKNTHKHFFTSFLTPHFITGIKFNSLNFIEYLLQHGIDVNTLTNNQKYNGLYFVQTKEMTLLLLKYKIDVNFYNDGKLIRIIRENSEIFELLMENNFTSFKFPGLNIFNKIDSFEYLTNYIDSFKVICKYTSLKEIFDKDDLFENSIIFNTIVENIKDINSLNKFRRNLLFYATDLHKLKKLKEMGIKFDILDNFNCSYISFIYYWHNGDLEKSCPLIIYYLENGGISYKEDYKQIISIFESNRINNEMGFRLICCLLKHGLSVNQYFSLAIGTRYIPIIKEFIKYQPEIPIDLNEILNTIEEDSEETYRNISNKSFIEYIVRKK